MLWCDAKKLRSILGFKVKSQLSVWMTFAAQCVEGFVKDKSQLCAWTTSAAECTEGFGRKDLQLSAQIRTVLVVKS